MKPQPNGLAQKFLIAQKVWLFFFGLPRKPVCGEYIEATVKKWTYNIDKPKLDLGASPVTPKILIIC